MIAGSEFGINVGKRMIIDKGLYGLETSAARFHEKLAETLRNMGFKLSKADHDLWMRDVDTHYEYIATYVDDLLVFSKNPMDIIGNIKETYDLKGVGLPEYYLGGDFDTTFKTATSKEFEGISTVDHHDKKRS